ncbi:protein timeless homolog [Diorhabda sublineata]|uniref:protein timeless homolog n=1 Tax=Diorhabda sublineata TaxID=1163346 RepID=UPI0024E096CD|nr:protein timeless homolog [Diorhabda sublineata]XP_056642813.1 protein timeless homolog [Diorhabda sublineata]XP_056642814.1 protein timeless homolog [Diorhabda sublineata]
MSSLLSAEISATCNALGYFDEKTNKYYADSNTLETVKDIIRYLRRDDELHSIRRQLGDTKVLITDLLPLLKHYHEENDLFDVLLRLIMNLTTPPLLLFNFEIPTDKVVRNYYLEMEDHLKFYKEAFVDEAIWAVFSTHLSKVLEVDNSERAEENSVKIERILVLMRNVLFVSDDSIDKRPDNDASLHDQVLWALHHSGLLDIILYITTNPAEQGYFVYILEILFFMLRNQQPNELANAALQRSQREKIRDEAELVNIRHSELNIKHKKTKIYTGTRHSRFGGTFVVQSMKSINDNNLLISHKPLNKLDSINFDADKKLQKTARNRTPLLSNQVDRRSAFTIRLFLKEFCIEFLNGAYNNVMQYIKGLIARHSGDNQDESYYLWALGFFMSFNRHYKFEVKLISETLSVQTFHFVQQQCENYLDLMKTDKKKVLIWSKRLHTALLSYKELLLTLFVMDKSKDEVVTQSSKVIKSNIFYLPEYREFIITLLIMYDELQMTDLYLKDLMETQHLFLKMFEVYCKTEGTIIVKKKSKSKMKNKTGYKVRVIDLNLDDMWDEASPQISAILESGGEFLTDVPFDAASDVPLDQQKIVAMEKIQHKLRNSEYESAIGIMRAAREVWPENNSFGNDNLSSEEEFLCIREIFYADLGKNKVENTEPIEEDEYDEYDDEEVDQDYRQQEISLDFKDFVKRLVHPKIVRVCALALKNFDTNSINTNHSVLKLMHRIAFDCKYYVMMFQLSLFRTFQRMFTVKDLPQYNELIKFARYILRNFFKFAQTNPKVFIEILFWTSRKEAFEIEHGDMPNDKVTVKKWSEEEENELRTLFEEHNSKQIKEDIVDWILSNLVKQTRTRRMVLGKLRELDLIDDYKKGRISRSTNSQYWSADEEIRLRELYSEFKNSPDLLNSIMNGLITPKPKNKVIEKMLSLHLIQDKNELTKNKPLRKKGKKNTDFESDTNSLSIPTKHRNTPNQKNLTIAIATKNDIMEILLENINAGNKEPVDWLNESIFDVIEDFEENHGGIPLVPLSNMVENAMENDTFQKLLSSLGFAKPVDEQETYWRIPGYITLDTLKMFHDLITKALENNLTCDAGTKIDIDVSNTGLSLSENQTEVLNHDSDKGDQLKEQATKRSRSSSAEIESPPNKRRKSKNEN